MLNSKWFFNGFNGAGSTPVSSSILYGYNNFTGVNYFTTAGSTAIAGNATGFWVSTLMRPDSLNSANKDIFNKFSALPGGWSVRYTSGNTILFICVNGAGTTVSSPAYSLTAADVGKVMLIVGVNDGSFIRLYINGTEVGNGTAIVGYSSNPSPTAFGRRSSANTLAATETTIFGCAGSDVMVPSAAQIQQYAQDVKAGRSLVAMAGASTEHLWVVPSTVLNVSDSIGSDTMNSQGLVSVASGTLPADWGF